MGLTIYLTVYPQPFPPLVCNAQLDTSVKKSTICEIYTTIRGRIYQTAIRYAIESGGLVMTW